MHMLIAEPERKLAEELRQKLSERRYTADLVYNGADAIESALKWNYDVILLDSRLPGINGYDVTRELRAQKLATPIMLVVDEREVVAGTGAPDCGADGYIGKSITARDLLTRVREIARRRGRTVVETMEYGDLVLDMQMQTLACGEKQVRLSRKEFDVLRILMSVARGFVTKRMLIDRVWGAASSADANNVEAYISFLRKKFFQIGSKVTIVTLRKVGYQLSYEEKR